jgi:hypothetical protein
MLGASGSSMRLAESLHPLSVFAALWHVTESSALKAQFLVMPLTGQQ